MGLEISSSISGALIMRRLKLITQWGLCEEQLQSDRRVSWGLLVPLRQTELVDRDSRLYHREPRVCWRCPRRSLRTCIASRRLKTIAELSQDQPVVHAAQRGRCLKTLFSSKALSEGVWALLGKPCGSKSKRWVRAKTEKSGTQMAWNYLSL